LQELQTPASTRVSRVCPHPGQVKLRIVRARDQHRGQTPIAANDAGASTDRWQVEQTNVRRRRRS